ncbi:hypothetical protein EV175_005293, partial [Coemansia sp. RSA 1933]
MGILTDFLDYRKSTGDVFKDIAGHAPSLCDKRLIAHADGAHLVGPKTTNEAGLVDYFKHLWVEMTKAANALNSSLEGDQPAVPTPNCKLVDHQNKYIPGSRQKADIVFYQPSGECDGFKSIHTVLEAKIDSFPGIELPELERGQIADYALSV